MAGKKTSQNEATQQIVTKYDRKVQRRKEAEAKEKKQKQFDKLIGIVIAAAIVIALASVPVSKYIANNSTYITVGGHNITRVEYDYYYNLVRADYINSLGSYYSYLGLDLTGDLSKVQYDENMTWKDYFDSMAVDMIKQNMALLDAAEAAGFTYDASEDYAEFKETVKESAQSAGVTAGRYYRETFGKYASASNLKTYIEEGYVAEAYYNSVEESQTPSEAEVQAYYEDNKATYDTVDYLVTEVLAEIEVDLEAGEEGSAETTEPDEATVAAAMEEAKAKAEAALETIDTDGTEESGVKSEIATVYADWLYEDTRAEGDTTVIEDADNNKYYAVKFVKRYLDDDATANIRVILSGTVSCEDMLAELEAGGNTEDTFIALVEKYSEDTYSNTNGGLYEELSAASLDDEMSQWINEEGRKEGDIFSYTDDSTGSNYVLYYVSEGRPAWQVSIENTLVVEEMNQYIADLKATYEVEDPKGHLDYLTIEETDDSTTAATTESTAE